MAGILGSIGAGILGAQKTYHDLKKEEELRAQQEIENAQRKQELAIPQALADQAQQAAQRKMDEENFKASQSANPTGWMDDPNVVAQAGQLGVNLPKENVLDKYIKPRLQDIEGGKNGDVSSAIPSAPLANAGLPDLKQRLEGVEGNWDQITPTGKPIAPTNIPENVSVRTGVKIPSGVMQQRTQDDIMAQVQDYMKNNPNAEVDPKLAKVLQFGAMMGTDKPIPAGYLTEPSSGAAAGFDWYTDKQGKQHQAPRAIGAEMVNKGEWQKMDTSAATEPRFQFFQTDKGGVWLDPRHPGAPPVGQADLEGNPIRGKDTQAALDKKEAKRVVANTLDTLETISQKLITKVGPRQRADALVRGWDAVLGNDPDYQNYRAARQAAGMNLAISQQGKRPSDVESAMWTRMIPDPLAGDTRANAPQKWHITRIMIGLDNPTPEEVSGAGAATRKPATVTEGWRDQ